jgi:hypothetical protein
MLLVLMLVFVVCQDDSFASSCCLYVLLFHFLELLFIDCYEQMKLPVHQVGVGTTRFQRINFCCFTYIFNFQSTWLIISAFAVTFVLLLLLA